MVWLLLRLVVETGGAERRAEEGGDADYGEDPRAEGVEDTV